MKNKLVVVLFQCCSKCFSTFYLVVWVFCLSLDTGPSAIQKETIEERVTILELEMVNVKDDIDDLTDSADLLFQQQIIQDQRMYNMEQEMDQQEDSIGGCKNCSKHFKEDEKCALQN